MTPPALAQRPAPVTRGRPVQLLPFVAASNEHVEPMDDRTLTPGAAAQQVGPISVPAYGYLRHLAIEVTCSGGTLGAGVLHPDFPFNIFQQLTLSDVNGAPIFGPLTGFQTFLANLYGAYAFRSDPRVSPDYDATIAAKFIFRIPVEIAHHSALGALANQSAAAAYKLSYTLNILTGAQGMFTTAPTTPPNIRVRCWLEAWAQPARTDMAGRPQATRPPNHGTTQFWSVAQADLQVGQKRIPLTRVGSLIRTLVFVVRDANGLRVTGLSTLPDTVELSWDQQQLRLESSRHRRQEMAEGIVTPLSNALAFDGVLAYSFDNSVSGRFGDGSPSLYMPTVQSTRLDVNANWPQAGTLEILTNDVAPAEVNPEERYDERNATTFDPGGPGAPTPMNGNGAG